MRTNGNVELSANQSPCEFLPIVDTNKTDKEAKNSDVLMKWIAVLKSTFLREERYLDALKFINIALTLEPEDAFEVRDRGYIYQQLDCTQSLN